MERQTLIFAMERETKNTVRYQEVAVGKPPVVGTLCVQRWSLGEPAPQRLAIVIEGTRMMDGRGGKRSVRHQANDIPGMQRRDRRRRGATAAPAARRPVAASRDIYELSIELVDIEPPIWRRVVIPASATLAELHRVVQIVMGWYDSHLHEFTTESGQRYAVLSPDEPQENVASTSDVALHDVLREAGAPLTYEYDFGDGWLHRIELVRIHSPASGERYPRCLAGERACPPEDCGGPPGYEELLEALADPEHERHAELREWLGPGFQPEAFDIDAVNRALLRGG